MEKSFLQAVDNWFTKPAQWWQFWYPMSLIGGLFMGLAVPTAMLGLIWLFAR